MGIRPAKDLSWSHTPDTAEDSKPTAELPLLLRPVAALQPRISAVERSRSLYFRCKKQQKQLVLRGIHTIHQAMPHHRSYQIRYTGESRCPRQKWIPAPCSLPGAGFAGKARRDVELHQLNESVH